MGTLIRMPKLGDDIVEAAVIAWLKGNGDSVRNGEIIAEIETEKASVELEAEDDGVLQILVDAGRRVAIGTPIATIGEVSEVSEFVIKPAPRSPEPQVSQPEPQVSQSAAARAPVDVADEQRDPGEQGGRMRSSPSARKLAVGLGVDLSVVTGTGPGGRISRADVERAASVAPAAAMGLSPMATVGLQGADPPGPAGAGEGSDTLAALSPFRTAMARRMETSKRTAPHFYVTIEVRMDAALRLISEIGAGEATITHLLLRAVALAAAEHPRVNASWVDGQPIPHQQIDIGLAIELEEGLISPALIDCAHKSVLTLAAETRDLVARARAGRLTVAEVGGGTITVSNLGMFGVDGFVAILNPPQVAIVAVGRVAERPVVEGGYVAAARTMRVTCSADHRALDGVDVARFLATLRRLLEEPTSLVS